METTTSQSGAGAFAVSAPVFAALGDERRLRLLALRDQLFEPTLALPVADAGPPTATPLIARTVKTRRHALESSWPVLTTCTRSALSLVGGKRNCLILKSGFATLAC